MIGSVTGRLASAAVNGESAPLKTSWAVPQSDAPEGAPRAVHKLASVGVVIDANDPSSATQFTTHGAPPRVALNVRGKFVPAAATMMKCVAPKTDTESDGVLPIERAEVTSDAIAVCAGAHRGSVGELHETDDEFAVKTSLHEGDVEKEDALRVRDCLKIDFAVVPRPAAALQSPGTARLSLKIPAMRGHEDGSAIADKESVVERPYLGYSAPAVSTALDETVHVTVDAVDRVEFRAARVSGGAPTTMNCRGRFIDASAVAQALPTALVEHAVLPGAEMTESADDDELHFTVRVSVGDGSDGSVMKMCVFSQGHDATTVSDAPGSAAPLGSVGAESDREGVEQPLGTKRGGVRPKHEKGGFVADGVGVNVGLGVGDGDEEGVVVDVALDDVLIVDVSVDVAVKVGLCVPDGVGDAVVEPVGLKLIVDEGVVVQLGAIAAPVVVQPPQGHGMGLTVAKGQ